MIAYNTVTVPVQSYFLRLLLTLSYSHVFDKGLSIADLYLRQVALASYDFISWPQVTAAVAQLRRHKVIRIDRDQILPFDRIIGDELTTGWSQSTPAHLQAALQASKLAEAEMVASLLNKLPWVQAVALTGSVAVGNTKPKDDCDFFIITTPHTLWLTRLVVLWIAKLHGKRRSFAKEESDSWCFNMWLSDNSLVLPVNMRSLYTAYELCQAVWLVNKNLTAQRFIALNSWARRLLPVYYLTAYQAVYKHNTTHLPGTKTLFWLIGVLTPLLNAWCFLMQYLYMLPHKTSEWVGYSHAFFHPRPTGQLTLHKLQSWLEYYLYSKTERKPKKKIKRVLVTGVFDLLHTKHRQLLQQSARLGQLWVGVESDQRTRTLKGWDRPLQPAWWKVMQLNRLAVVSRAFILPTQIDQEEVQRQLLAKIKPDILAVSASTPHLAQKKRLMAEIGGRVEVVLPHDQTISTTQIVQAKR